mmetsp:Transcript_24424/g.55796  ORF Transcript_24424/g.55796 Transcript_24424/m.55796 type:complete len:108 (-) Transcript_24424:797-1120(-)
MRQDERTNPTDDDRRRLVLSLVTSPGISLFLLHPMIPLQHQKQKPHQPVNASPTQNKDKTWCQSKTRQSCPTLLLHQPTHQKLPEARQSQSKPIIRMEGDRPAYSRR